MLGLGMNWRIFLSPLILLFSACDDGEPVGTYYEPLFLNETYVDVSLVWSCDTENGGNPTGSEMLEPSLIPPNDTAYSVPGESFPLLHEDGLSWCFGDGEAHVVKIVFGGGQKSCLLYGNGRPAKDDIMSFSSYENIGLWDGNMRGANKPYGMLYRITEEMRASAKPCE